MKGSGSRIPDKEAPSGGPPRAPARRPENETPPPAFLGDARDGVACEICGVALQLGHWAVRFPCGQGRHVPHASCVVETLPRGAAAAPLRCPAANCGAQHLRRDALEAAAQARPGLRSWTGKMGGEFGEENLHSRVFGTDRIRKA